MECMLAVHAIEDGAYAMCSEAQSMNMQKLMLAHKYDEVIAESRRHLVANPADLVAMGWIASALQAKGAYRQAIEWLERGDSLRSEEKQFKMAVPGYPGSRVTIACLHWLLGEHPRAILDMHASATGILDRTIKYADAAGGMTQGLLLYYMAVTAKVSEETSYALDYLRNRVENLRKHVRERVSELWPCPVAQYLLGDRSFESVMEKVEPEASLAMPDAAARLETGRRNRLRLAVFCDGVKSRAEGNETHCLSRMREAYLLQDQAIIWLFARYEIDRAMTKQKDCV
jgi:hypothetical protein